MICWWQMRWNIFCYHSFKFSCQFRLIWLSDQTSFCKIKSMLVKFHKPWEFWDRNLASEHSQDDVKTVSLAKSYSFLSLFFLVLFLVLGTVSNNCMFFSFRRDSYNSFLAAFPKELQFIRKTSSSFPKIAPVTTFIIPFRLKEFPF